MTALEKYARLEGPGVWKAGPGAQRRDVVVWLGESSLMIADARSGVVVSHWSLPAVRRLNRGHKPAIYTPSDLTGAPAGADGDGETLEIDDATLIEALDTIRAALAPRRPLRRLRAALLLASVVALVAMIYWLPGVLVARTAAIVPPAMRTEIGREALAALTAGSSGPASGSASTPATGPRVCADPHGRQALASLRNRVLGGDWRVRVVAGVPGLVTASLPGRLMILSQDLVERLDSAEALAGWMLAEQLAFQAHDPLRDALGYAGVRATLALLTTGTLPEGALNGYARRRLARPPALPEAAAIGPRLDALGLSPTAYALSLPPAGAALAEALADRPTDPARRNTRLLSDGEWLTLQAICAD